VKLFKASAMHTVAPLSPQPTGELVANYSFQLVMVSN